MDTVRYFAIVDGDRNQVLIKSGSRELILSSWIAFQKEHKFKLLEINDNVARTMAYGGDTAILA